MTKPIQPRKVPMWQFFNENVGAAGPVHLGPFDELNDGTQQAAMLFIEALKGRERVLDLGCGTGMPGLYVASHVGELVGVDAAPNMVAAARQNASSLELSNARFLVAGADGLPFEDEEFDAVSMLGLLESMGWDEVHRVMAEVWRVLEPGGRIAVLEQDWRDVLRRKPRRQARIQTRTGRLTLEIFEREDAPGLERHTRYLVDPDSPSGHKLMGELGESARVGTSTELRDLRRDDILDAWYDDGAQFDARTLAELVDSHGFREIEVRALPIWAEGMLFLTASG